jgi:hypothetical protein
MALVVKIHIVAGQNSSTKILKFPPEMSIHQMLKEIKEKTNVGGEDFGLFMQGNPEKKQKPKWLDRTKSLKNYFIKNNVSTLIHIITRLCDEYCPTSTCFYVL